MVKEVTTTSWGKRIINALWGIIIGIVLVIGSVYLVFWNEGHGLHTAQALQQAQKILVSIPASPVDPQNNMRVVYLTGMADTENVLQDSEFNVSVKAIQLHRKVEMYQWKENVETSTEKNLGGSETETKNYTYELVWSTHHIDSANFKDPTGHQNPAEMPLKSHRQYAERVTVGDFKLPTEMVKQISGDTTVDLSKVDLKSLQERYHKPAHLDGDQIYLGDDSSSPKVGDLRISISTVLPQTISLIAQQSGKTLQPFVADSGQTVSLLEMGQVSPQLMIVNAESENSMMTWIWRVVALILLVVGFAMILNPLSVIADVIPFVGSIVGVGTGFVAFIAGFCVWALAVAIAWFAVRPFLAVGILVVVGIICYLLYTHRKKSL